ncbi:hypothetical protein [Natrarchaeobaculum sulfurireducens]|uniref:hypothetical protein n=1 Tax=Natrarchaeobaculum sulfurireducens TaxID=2044521 RepID=UPI0012B54E00|nr:hypothetical protein [Natrarchaeobaculum sulfurireducens]
MGGAVTVERRGNALGHRLRERTVTTRAKHLGTTTGVPSESTDAGRVDHEYDE